MNLKLKRVARTAYSEELAIFDADTKDDNDSPVNIGKLDMHFAGDQIVGTLLIWQEYAAGYNRLHAAGSETDMDALIDEILTEATEPLGIPSEYGIEVYYPPMSNHSFISNYATEDDEETGDDASENDQDSFTTDIRRYGADARS